MSEEQLILRIAITQAIAQLPSEADRAMVALYYQLDDLSTRYPDYEGAWPPTFKSVAEYVGIRFGDGPLAESTIRYRMGQVLERWRTAGVFAQ